jgi:hypothetical protein
MAKRAVPANGLFAAAEATLIGLYDAGVLSPAVLQHVIAGFANSAIDWNTAPRLRTVGQQVAARSGRHDHDAGTDLTPSIERIFRGDRAYWWYQSTESTRAQPRCEPEEPDEPPEDEPDSDLINQLSGGRRRQKSG